MVKLVIAILLLVATAGGYYYYEATPAAVLKHATEHALDDFSAAVATKDRAKIGDALKTLLTDSARIRLEVNFFSIIKANTPPPMKQDFDKAGFIAFLDNTLYALSDYSYTVQLQEFRLAPDRKTAEVAFTSKEWADGESYYSGTAIDMRFSSDTTCDGHVIFEANRALLDTASCSMQLRSVPKPGQERKLMNPDALKELLR